MSENMFYKDPRHCNLSNNSKQAGVKLNQTQQYSAHRKLQISWFGQLISQNFLRMLNINNDMRLIIKENLLYL